MKQDMIVILDLGNTQNTATARAIRELGVYSEIYPHDITLEELNRLPNVKGIIINGGENHIVDGAEIFVNDEIYQSEYPILAVNHPATRCQKQLDFWPTDSEQCSTVLKEFIFDICQADPNWNMKNFISDQIELVRRQVGDKKVLLALSGGVDSSVVQHCYSRQLAIN